MLNYQPNLPQHYYLHKLIWIYFAFVFLMGWVFYDYNWQYYNQGHTESTYVNLPFKMKHTLFDMC